MLIKIQNIEEDIGELEDEVDDLKHRINKMLKEEQIEKKRSKEQHEEAVNM
jgi:hypothetical protein